MSHLITRRVLPTLGAAALLAGPAAAASPALAAPTPAAATPAGVAVSGGHTSIKLGSSFAGALRKLHIRAGGGRFRVNGGNITSPATDGGTITQRGSLVLTLGATKVTFLDPVATLGRSASLGFGRVKLPMSGGAVTRSGFDSGVAGAKVKLDTSTAKLLNRVFKAMVFKKGQTLGTLTTTQKLAGIVTASGTTSVALSTMASQKLAAGGVMPSAIKPATITVTPSGPAIAFPLARGSVVALGANGFPVGKLLDQGGLTLSQPSSGHSLTTTNYRVDTTVNPPLLVVNVTPALSGAFAELQPSSKPTINPKARTITLTGIVATLDPLAASILSQQFPAAGFQAGDVIGTATVTIQAQ